ncbi:MAG: MerR family transcriptional regulator [Candidatus Omnitrophica bacterium]|nr:MerR family transcriptional regulator [Candidatus Omnitrophota bacterium]MDD5652934.1 MerR family transcriptional regulator [Candidatus Omnitrophota bacterium]
MRKIISSVEVCVKFGLPYSTLTHYTNLGLLKTVGRRGNKRLYEEGEVSERLLKIKTLANKGYPLLLIRDTISDTSV